MPNKPTLFYRSVDDYLGPREQRFFGSGYRRVDCYIGDISVAPENASGTHVQGVASIVYPYDWSTKRDQIDLCPHFSSIDALVISAQLSEICLTHAYGFDDNMRRDMRLRKVTLRAGSTPQQDLKNIPLAANLQMAKPLVDDGERCVSTIDCRLGLMSVRCEVEHHMVPLANIPGAYHSIEDMLGPPASRYYGEGFKARKQRIEDVRVDMEILQTDACVYLESMHSVDGGTRGIRGINGNYQPSISMIDCLVVIGQMLQIMMYELDAVQRQNSNTLWMRHTVLEEVVPPRKGTGTQDILSVDAQVTTRSKKLLSLRGSVWRILDIVGYCGGVTIQLSVVHELPSLAQ